MSHFVGSDNVTKDCWKRVYEFMHTEFGDPSVQAKPIKESFVVQANTGSAPLPNNHLSYEVSRDDAGDQTTDAAMAGYAEADVDAMRAQRDVQLGLYVQEMQMKEKLNAKLNKPSGATDQPPQSTRSRPKAESALEDTTADDSRSSRK